MLHALLHLLLALQPVAYTSGIKKVASIQYTVRWTVYQLRYCYNVACTLFGLRYCPGLLCLKGQMCFSAVAQLAEVAEGALKGL
jgi:hypothetical protein